MTGKHRLCCIPQRNGQLVTLEVKLFLAFKLCRSWERVNYEFWMFLVSDQSKGPPSDQLIPLKGGK